MCPGCVASAAMMIAGVMSTGGLAAVVMNRLGVTFRVRKSFQKQNPKEETWAK
jgi:hypothetical protein